MKISTVKPHGCIGETAVKWFTASGWKTLKGNSGGGDRRQRLYWRCIKAGKVVDVAGRFGRCRRFVPCARKKSGKDADFSAYESAISCKQTIVR
jgi:hypothetical protein